MTGTGENDPQGTEGENAGATGSPSPSPEQAPAGKSRDLRVWLLALFGLGAVVSVGLYILWPSEPEVTDFRTALFQALQLSEGDTLLFVNLPPAAGRYPGSILLFDGNIPLEFVTAEDTGLMQGQPVDLERQVRVASSAELGIGMGGSQGWLASAASALSRREGEVDVTVAFTGSTVESRDLVTRVAASALARNISESGVDAYVIVRAWRGTVTLNIQSRSGTSAQVLDSLSATLDSIAASAGAGVRFTGDLESGQRGVLRLSENDVFAFQGLELAPFYRLAAGIAPDDPVAGGDAGTRPAVPRPRATLEAAVGQYMRLDPDLLPPEDRERALSELGPGAAAAVISVMERGEAEQRERGMTLLQELPPSAFAVPSGAEGVEGGALDAALRARTILDLSAETPAERVSLGTALRDPSPAVRYLASERLEAAGTAAARATLISRADTSDPAVRTAVSAARFETAQLQGTASAATVVQGADRSLALGSVRATRSATLDPGSKLDVFIRGLASDDAEVVKESLRGLAEMGPDARSAIPAVERLMTSTRDPRLRDLARRLLARLRAGDG